MAGRLPQGPPENPVPRDPNLACSTGRGNQSYPYGAYSPNLTIHRSGEPSLPFPPFSSPSDFGSTHTCVPSGHGVGQRTDPRTPSILINEFYQDLDNKVYQAALQSPYSSAAGSLDESFISERQPVFPVHGAYGARLVRTESRDSNASGYDDTASIAHSCGSANDSFDFDRPQTSLVTPATSAGYSKNVFPASAPGPLGGPRPSPATSSPYLGGQLTTTPPKTSVKPRFGHSRTPLNDPPPGAHTNYSGTQEPLLAWPAPEPYGDVLEHDFGSVPSSNTHPLDHFPTSASNHNFAEPLLETQALWIDSPAPPRSHQSLLTVPPRTRRRASESQRPRPFSTGSEPIAIPGRSPSQALHRYMPQNSPTQPHSPAAPEMFRSSRIVSAASLPLPRSTTSGGVRGKRNGPMKTPARESAKKTRTDRSICIACKQKKQGCIRPMESPNSSCVNCVKHASKRPGPCFRAYFDDIVSSGALNYISQRAIHHISIDGSKRICKPLPEEFPLDEVIRTLQSVAGRFDLRVSQGGRSMYVLRLDQCRNYLSRLRDLYLQKGYEPNMSAFIDKELFQDRPRSDNWTSMITDCQASTKDDKIALLLALGNMPSRATYSYVPLPHRHAKQNSLSGRNIDPEAAHEEKYLTCAAHLARIIARKVEVEAYTHIQTRCHNANQLSDADLNRLLQNIGLLLVSLRWRHTWWGMLGDGTVQCEPHRGDYEVRVRELCEGLYFWFCSLRRRFPPSPADVSDKLSGVHSHYADTTNSVWDAFPGRDQESREGFNVWLGHGPALVIQAGAATTVHTGLVTSLS
ncbi:conserved hypothetical protein [Verticillium alfalfae VaMs.102]|uniref:Uncharacterized protein n=1 Tax=Verticillium alfalfae (strain VaMs.102 / ATCC MYA-4576 / FGSC 10136) TaxID=526221 RepID=C9SJ05_VERA1|nr:conserved hypothetical protein [Verticillium alfalfae VaMs.102]EEY18928.1 conserved hypothetical protein [Verticillium alfalfae VaMs.102]